ncbi:hypothetical protein VNI00_011687 [Paramarasmius palmivorus]|uniref:Uncharacterized protein n=1 Tax=Paramarasmius palmivorus TaxID=297713 RepID=A0AAW0CBA8_9AGAR
MTFLLRVNITLRNSGSAPMKVKNLSLTWGVLYLTGKPDEIISPDQVEGEIIGPNETLEINARARPDSPSGTEGSFDLVDVGDGDKTIRHFYWDCPWGSKKSTWSVSGSNESWTVDYEGGDGQPDVIIVHVTAKKDEE